MTGSFDWGLVFLSIVISVVASFVMLDVVPRIAASRNSRTGMFWLAGGAVATGTGIWAAHFISVLAFALPI